MSNRFRHEQKYRINALESSTIEVIASSLLSRDSHVAANGKYTVRSLYFDDLEDSCLSENISGTDPRAKFRIRYYNDNTDRISLEKKTKKRQMCLKESVLLTSSEAETLINGNYPPLTDDELKNRLFTEMAQKSYTPKVIVTYTRIPFVYPAGNVRITFDKDIMSSSETGSFLSGNYANRPILSLGESILEVKWDELLPLHIKDVMRLDELSATAFSKYYMCRVLGI